MATDPSCDVTEIVIAERAPYVVTVEQSVVEPSIIEVQTGMVGPAGPTGPTGPPGADSTVAGPTGPTGPAGSGGGGDHPDADHADTFVSKQATYAEAPAAAEIRIENDYYDGNVTHRDVMQVVSNGTLTSWLNEWGALRTRKPAENLGDATARFIDGSDFQRTGQHTQWQTEDRSQDVAQVLSNGLVLGQNIGNVPVYLNAASRRSSRVRSPAGPRIVGAIPFRRWRGIGVPDGQVKRYTGGPGDSYFDYVDFAGVVVSGGQIVSTDGLTTDGGRVEWDAEDVPVHYWSFALTPTHPSASLQFFSLYTATNERIAHLRVSGTQGNVGAIRIYNRSNAQVAETTYQMGNGIKHYVAVALNTATGVVTVEISNDSRVLQGSASGNCGYTGQIDRVVVGVQFWAAADVSMTFGDLVYTGYPRPLAQMSSDAPVMTRRSDKTDVSETLDPTNEWVGRWDIVDDGSGSSNWPDRLSFRFNGVRTGSFNEYGEIRVEAAKQSTVAMRAHGAAGGASVPIFQVRSERGGSDILNVGGPDGIVAATIHGMLPLMPTWKGTRAQYDALGQYSDDVQYVILPG